MIVRVSTNCHTQYTWDSSICIFLFNRTTLPSFCYIPYRCSICAPFVILQTSTRKSSSFQIDNLLKPRQSFRKTLYTMYTTHHFLHRLSAAFCRSTVPYSEHSVHWQLLNHWYLTCTIPNTLVYLTPFAQEKATFEYISQNIHEQIKLVTVTFTMSSV